MSIPKAIRGQIPGFTVSRALRASMWIRHKGMLRCARIVACSHALKNDIVRFFECDPSKVSVVHDGINHSVFPPIHDRVRLSARSRSTAYRPTEPDSCWSSWLQVAVDIRTEWPLFGTQIPY